ncbi:DUF4064 domain-containing protein [Bacillus sp. T33-2]|uniref:DUF4064 domain-containing protein n=1 Tax=Bacillus sp. T33-2 TaxID=2054168 RepID=UPI000C7919E8|nr:DUF4064 domain-containing protein [Bacillus sp. T33-2]PLR99578.1 hypothetical protein CVD19_00515 [Bacillus sp. T33-2]
MKRTTEFVLGLLGGIFGFIAAILALVVGGVDAAFSSSGTSEVIGLGWAAILLSIVGIVGSVFVKFKPKFGGILMLISAIGGVISISMFYMLPGLLLLIAGLMGVFRKDKTASLQG